MQGAHFIIAAEALIAISNDGAATGSKWWQTRKKKAVVAVARKPSVLLHRLWENGEMYEPLRNQNLRMERNKDLLVCSHPSTKNQ